MGAFKVWGKVAGCYVLKLSSGKMVIIPSFDISDGEVQSFEDVLRQKIDKIVMTRLSQE